MNNNLKGKRLLLLGGSLWKNIIKEFADNNGIVLIATGNDQSAGIFEIAHEKYVVDSTNEAEMKVFIKEKKIDGVYLGGSENVISSASKYLNDLGLPVYCNNNQWTNLNNKIKFKQLCEKFGLPIVRQYNLTFKQIEENSKNIEFPVITKPTDSSGSSGFSICRNYDELLNGFIKAREASKSNSVLIEEFVNNKGIVVFYTFSNGKMYFNGIEDKYPIQLKNDGSFVAGFLNFPSKKESEFIDRFNNQLSEMFNSIGIREGTVWLEVFSDGNKYYFNEAGYRYGGSVSIYPIDYYYNVNQVASDIYFALTGESRIHGWDSIIKNNVPKKKYYGIYTVFLKPGKIKEIYGMNRIKELSNIVYFPKILKEDSLVSTSGTISNVFSFIHFVYDSEEELNETLKRIHSDLSIVSYENEEMVAQLLDPSLIVI